MVDIVNGYRLDGQGIGVQVLIGARFFFFPCLADQFWGQPILLSNGYLNGHKYFNLWLCTFGLKGLCCIQMHLHCCKGVTLPTTYMVPHCKADICIRSGTIHEEKFSLVKQAKEFNMLHSLLGGKR
jgi:hypothetical protein